MIATGPAKPAEAPVHRPYSRRKCFALVFACTVIGAAAQVLIKMGAMHLTGHGLIAMLTNAPLMAGYSLYGISTVALVYALRDGELSLLYPVIALTYVWVTLLSFILFRETISPFKLVGIATIVAGVGVLGMGGKR
jgi:drug/metabolite transporter (DMT)-like permease